MSRPSPVRRAPGALLALLALALLVPAAAQAHRSKQLYVSLGDSYATGYQATGQDEGRNTRKGFAYQVPGLARERGHDLELVNFGCGGATTSSILRSRKRCLGPAPDGPRYRGRTQIAAAERFLREHRGEVGLITVSIGGNDVTACALPGADPTTCVGQAAATIERNVGELNRRLRKAAGRGVPIVGITYPDVILGRWVTGQPADQQLAKLSVAAFQQLINPTLKASYESVRGKFVDVTAATGAYGPLEQTTTLAPYGVVPVPVAEVCRLTYYCQFRDIHANTAGYRVIADLIVRTLPHKH